MRLAGLTFIFIIFISRSVYAFQSITSNESEETLKLRSAVESISKAYVSRDPVPFEQLFLANHAGIRERPVFNLREQLIAMMRADSVILRAGRKLDFETISYENDEPHIVFYGAAAIVSVSKKNHWRYRGQNCITRARSTELWVKKADRWKIAAGHSTVFPCDPLPYHPIHPAVADIPPSSRAPQNADIEAERQIKELIDAFTRARLAGDNSLADLMNDCVAPDFIFTSVNGQTSRDRSSLRELEGPAPSRPLGLRNQDDAIVIYDNAAIYTYRRRPSSMIDGPQQVTIMFARMEGKWMMVAGHATKY